MEALNIDPVQEKGELIPLHGDYASRSTVWHMPFEKLTLFSPCERK
jgi:hypothetical protein